MSRRCMLLAIPLLVVAPVLVEGTASAHGSAERYIVILDDGADPAAHARANGVATDHRYAHAVRGYSATMSPAAAAALAGRPGVRSVEPDAVVTVAHHRPNHDKGGGGEPPPPEPPPPPPPECPGSQVLPWGIDRVDADLSSTLAHNCAGDIASVSIYVIDTGVDAGHPDLNVVRHVNFARGPNKDCHGHGTHVAGTAAARDNTSGVVGVAPGAPVTGVKVLGCDGSGWMSDVVAGVDWVTANAARPAVANMSLGGPLDFSLDLAVGNSMESGITYAVAAGNSGIDACLSSPSVSGTFDGVIGTGATDQQDRETSWSNTGSCVDIWAPGLSVLSTAMGGGTTTMSGTSMASPHAAGAAALYLSTNPNASPAQVEAAIEASGVLTGNLTKQGGPVLRLRVATF